MMGLRTLEHHSLPLVFLEHLGRPPLNRGIAVRLGKLDLHRFSKQRESVHDECILGRLFAVKHNKCLALALEARLGDNFDDFTATLEGGLKTFFKVRNTLALLEVADLYYA
jgi:hypothetical protein